MNAIERIKKEKMKKILRKENNKIDIEIEVNDNNFREKVIEQSKTIPVVVDFWAQWCMPCLILSPVLEKLVKEYKGKFILSKANVDENQRVSQIYGIMSIPAVKLFKDGRVVDEFIGALPQQAVKQWLDRNIKYK